MSKDKYTATWVSHSSIGDFLKCPRSYYLKNIYKDPKTNRKFQIINPYLALGQAVHEVVESLSVLPTKTRFIEPLLPKFEKAWEKVTLRKGGFFDPDTEYKFKSRGLAMLKRINDNPGPLANLAVKIDMDLPHYWLSEDDNIILCGKIDWLEYLPETDSVHIIDFKTSKNEEDSASLQLPIYHLLVHHCQKRTVSQASYWYLEISDQLTPKELPPLEEAQANVLKIAKQIKLARQLNHLKCPTDGCRACIPMEAVLRGEAEHVGVNDFGQDLYILTKQNDSSDGTIL